MERLQSSTNVDFDTTSCWRELGRNLWEMVGVTARRRVLQILGWTGKGESRYGDHSGADYLCPECENVWSPVQFCSHNFTWLRALFPPENHKNINNLCFPKCLFSIWDDCPVVGGKWAVGPITSLPFTKSLPRCFSPYWRGAAILLHLDL